MAAEIIVGAKVLTSDSQELGKVKKLEGAAFLVDAPRKLDFWLQNTIVKSGDAEALQLSVAEGDLGGYKMDNPNDHNAFHESLARDLDPNVVRANTISRGQNPGR